MEHPRVAGFHPLEQQGFFPAHLAQSAQQPSKSLSCLPELGLKDANGKNTDEYRKIKISQGQGGFGVATTSPGWPRGVEAAEQMQ